MDNNSETQIKRYQCHSCKRAFDYFYPVETVRCSFCEGQFCQLEEEILKEITANEIEERQRNRHSPPPHRPPWLRDPRFPGQTHTVQNHPIPSAPFPHNLQQEDRNHSGEPQNGPSIPLPRHLHPPRFMRSDDNEEQRQPPRIVRIQRIVETPNGSFRIESRSMQRESRPNHQIQHIHELFRRLLQARGGQNNEDYKADEAFVNSLLRYKIGTDISLQELKLTQNMLCCVCQDEYKEEEEIIEMPCKHMFHSECLLPWLQKRRSCPNCRDMLGGKED